MKLWLLRPIPNLPLPNPWEPWYDKHFGFVIRAETEAEARDWAAETSGDEGPEAWTPKWSTCVELTADGSVGIVMHDFAAA